MAVGIGIAGKMDNKDYRVYTVLGDGELDEGSIWEGVMAASHYHDNLLLLGIETIFKYRLDQGCYVSR